MYRLPLLLLILAFPALAQLSEPHIVKTDVDGCVRVRTDHDVTATEIACLTAGTAITVVDTSPHWREITFGTQQGWIPKKFIEPATAPSLDTSTTIPADAILEVHFIDVGQGDAIWIQTHDDGIDGNGRFEGLSIIIDGGRTQETTTIPSESTSKALAITVLR
jgi:hypothetical protein